MPNFESDSDGEAGQWVLIEREQDFCTVSTDNVRYEGELSVGDRVLFLWKNRRLSGTVRFLHDDLDECEKEAERLKRITRKSKDGSFHEDRPRKAAMKCKENLQKPNGKKEQKKQFQRIKTIRENLESEDLLNSVDYGKDSLHSDDDRTSTEDISDPLNDDVGIMRDIDNIRSTDAQFGSKGGTTEQERLLAEFGKHFNIDHQTLREFAKGNVSPLQGSLKRKSSPSKGIDIDKKVDNTTPTSKRRMTISVHRTYNRNEMFSGNMYRFPSNPEDEDEAVEVFENTNIYCSTHVYNLAANGTSATMVARRLLEGVFTTDALEHCSVTGLPPRGKGKAAYSDKRVKPYLCPKGVNAIVCRSMWWQKKRHFLKKKDETQVRQAIAVRLNEIQFSARSSHL